MTEQPSAIDCAEALDRLYEYLDGELTAERTEEVKAHLESCAPCMAISLFESAFIGFLEARTRAQGAPIALKKRILHDMLFKPEDA